MIKLNVCYNYRDIRVHSHFLRKKVNAVVMVEPGLYGLSYPNPVRIWDNTMVKTSVLLQFNNPYQGIIRWATGLLRKNCFNIGGVSRSLNISQRFQYIKRKCRVSVIFTYRTHSGRGAWSCHITYDTCPIRFVYFLRKIEMKIMSNDKIYAVILTPAEYNGFGFDLHTVKWWMKKFGEHRLHTIIFKTFFHNQK